MASYSVLSSEQISEIFAEYGLPSVENWKPLSGGLENTSVLVTTRHKQFVLTVLERKSRREAQHLAELLDYLAEHNFYTSRVCRTRAGDLLSARYEKPVLLKDYIPGIITPHLNEEALATIGRQIARLHLIPPPEYLPRAYSYGQQAFAELDHLSEPFITWLREKHRFIRPHLSDDLPRAFIHGDVFYDNVILSEAGTAITDFEEACYYYRIFDIAMAVVGMCAPEGEIRLPKVKALVAGYEAVQALQPSEKDRLRAFVVYAATAATFWRYRQYHVTNPDPAMQHHHRAMKCIADHAFLIRDKAFSKIFNH
ncbi:MAG: homoserine kinase [Tunicatimonas sp.]